MKRTPDAPDLPTDLNLSAFIGGPVAAVQPSTKDRRVPIQINVPPSLRRQFQQKLIDDGLTMQQFCENAIEKYISEPTKA